MFDDLPPGFTLNLNKFSDYKSYKMPYVHTGYPLGYLFGAFLRSGNAFMRKRVRKGKFVVDDAKLFFIVPSLELARKIAGYLYDLFGTPYSAIKFAPPSSYRVYSYNHKVTRFFQEFGPPAERHLPKEYLTRNKEYLRGIYDGISETTRIFTGYSHYVERPMVDQLHKDIGDYLGIDPKD